MQLPAAAIAHCGDGEGDDLPSFARKAPYLLVRGWIARKARLSLWFNASYWYYIQHG